MKKSFCIQYSYLNNIFEMLKDYVDNADVLKDYYRLESLLHRYSNNFYGENNDNLFELIDDDLAVYKSYKPYYPFVKEFLGIGHSEKELDITPSYKSKIISDKKAFNEAGAFFENQSQFFKTGFMDFKAESSDHLQFVSKDANTDGEVLFLKTIGEAFVFSPNYSNITKILILIHELEHVIDSFKNPNFFENIIIREIPAMFMEMIACDYMAKKFNVDGDNYKRKLYIHSIVKSEATLLVDKMQMLETFDEYQHMDKEKVIKLLEEDGFNIDYIKFLMEYTITQNFYYQISQLVAIELHYIYYQDKKLALTILEDIIMNGNDQNILVILEKYGIVLNKHVGRYESKLLTKVKKSKNK